MLLYDIGKKISPYRGLVLVVFPVFMLLCTWRETDNLLLTWPLGLILLFAGAGLRSWSIRYFGFRVRKKKFNPGLAMTGPYAYTRNPLYIANSLMLIGMSVLSGLLWLLPLLAVFSLFSYTCVALYEEGELVKQYPEEFEKYRKAVPRWFPRSSPYKTGPPLFSWPVVLKTEVGSIVEVIAVIVACVIKEMIGR